MQRQMFEQPRQMRTAVKERSSQIPVQLYKDTDGRRVMKLGDVIDCENHMVVYAEEDPPRIECPVCGEECETVYLNMYCEPVCCDECLRKMDVVDYWEDQME